MNRLQTQYLQIGEIVKPQGIRGEVKLKAMTSDLTRFARLESVFLLKKGVYEEVRVEKGRTYDGFAFLKLQGVSDRNAAELLRGVQVFVDREHAIDLDEDENFVCDLVGLTAVDTQGNEIGELTDVLTPNSICDVYVFDTPRGEMMIPALRRVVKEVDLDAGTIVLDESVLPEVAVWEDEPAERDE
ncbi:MAG: 16S rRNA processing protein RimM [Clostridia bacterium]|nr:16S rRNA processing protein RimM [Clostridia bacterium]MBQ6858983.1 16S rRNA processing protein RimM [Clostridia bacterium]